MPITAAAEAGSVPSVPGFPDEQVEMPEVWPVVQVMQWEQGGHKRLPDLRPWYPVASGPVVQ